MFYVYSQTHFDVYVFIIVGVDFKMKLPFDQFDIFLIVQHRQNAEFTDPAIYINLCYSRSDSQEYGKYLNNLASPNFLGDTCQRSSFVTLSQHCNAEIFK